MTTLGKKILNYRQNHYLTQKEFGEKIGVGQSDISGIERGQVNGAKNAVTFARVKAFFDLLETDRIEPSKTQLVSYIQQTPRRKLQKRFHGQNRIVIKRIANKTKLVVDPLSLKIVSELQNGYKFMWRVVLAGFAALALLIVLK